MPERINHPELLHHATVEAVLEGGEERIVWLVVWFEDVEVPHKDCPAACAGQRLESISTRGQKVPLAGSLFGAAVSGWNVEANQMDRPGGRGDHRRAGSRRQVPD